MKIFVSSLCAALLVSWAAFVFAADSPGKPAKLRHVVAFKFKDTAKPEQINQVVEAFRALKTKIPGIVALEYGTNVSTENLHKGLTHCFVLTFGTENDRNAYIVHPDHKAFGTLLGPVMADVFVIDYWAKE